MQINKTKIIAVLLLAVLLQSCSTVEKFNSRINTPRTVKELKKDVDYAQHKLQQLHPDLYHFISKKDLEYKFDSLRATITAPMTSYDFFFRLSPVVASIRQGHTLTIPLTRKLTSAEKKIEKTKGLTPLALYEFEQFDNRLYIVKNNSDDRHIQAGTEVLLVNGVKPAEIISKYRNTFASDGYNTTFISRRLGRGFTRFFQYRYGMMDSVPCTLSYNDTIRSVMLRRPVKPKTPELKKTKAEAKHDSQLKQAESKKRQLLGYDPLRKMYSKLLTFPVKDSSVAIMRVSDFMKGNYSKFYKNSFRLLDSLHTRTLILDVRDNGGGRLREINTLYSYLADCSFHLLKKSEVTFRTSLWHFGYYHGQPLLMKAVQTLLLPIIAGVDLYTYFNTVKGNDHKFYFALPESKLTKVRKTCFKGSVYVLINGGCFSATCLISSNLKGSKRATFVGEETGGSYNGCVAGFLPVSTLPASKLGVRYGLMSIEAPHTSEVDGRGIFPDVKISPTVEDRINGRDPELDWVMTQIINN